MIKTYRHTGFVALSTILILIGVSNAQAQGDPSWNIIFDEELEYVTNANRTTQAEAQIDEAQLTSALTLQGDFGQGKSISSQFQYRADQTYYSEDSQESQPRIVGSGQLNFGSQVDPLVLSLSHEKRQFLRNFADADVASNREDRDSVGAALTVQSRPTRPSVFSLNLAHTVTLFEQFELNDTQRSSADLRYTRRSSAITALGLNLGANQVSYDNLSEADYELYTAYGFFARTLRRIDYFFALGLNSVTLENGDTSESPYLELEITKTVGASQFSIGASNTVVDNSNVSSPIFADELAEVADDDEALSEGNINVREQFTHLSVYTALENTSLCRRCALGVQLELYEDEYETSPSFDESGARAGLSFAYQVSNRSRFEVSLAHIDRDFTNRVDEGFEQQQGSLLWSRSWGKHFSAGFYTRVETREFAAGGEYDTQFFGINLRYSKNRL